MKISKKLISALLALVMLLTMPVVHADATRVQVDLIGLYAGADGLYQPVPLSGMFRIMQQGSLAAVVDANADGSKPVNVPSGGAILLVPVVETMPEGVLVEKAGYSVLIQEGETNVVTIHAFAAAGLFTVAAGKQASFTLTDENGREALSFKTDANGDYALQTAIPAGMYTLTMTSPKNGWEPKTVEIVTYTGEQSILHIDADYVYTTPAPVIVTPDPTAEPTEILLHTPASTAEPTAVQTETPAPTAEPTAVQTATPEPTATPTAVPTATPEPTVKGGQLTLEATGSAVEVNFTISGENLPTYTGVLSSAQPSVISDMAPGSYTVTLHLPEDVLLTRLLTYDMIQRGEPSWGVGIEPDCDFKYTVELTRTGGVKIPLTNVSAATAEANGPRGSSTGAAADGALTVNNLVPDEYTLRIHLPAGRYLAAGESENYEFIANEDGTVTAETVCYIRSGVTTNLPGIIRDINGSASGRVSDVDGRYLANITVDIYGESGERVLSVVTDANGQWFVPELVYGVYTLRYNTDEDLLLHDQTITINDAAPAAYVQANAAHPARITVHAFVDANENGSRGGSEKDASGVLVQLIAADHSVAAQATTGSNGEATLEAPAGQYRIRATAPEGYGFSVQGEEVGKNHSIMPAGAANTQTSASIHLEGEKTMEVGIGLKEYSSVSGTYWHDANADGIWQQDEPGIPGARVTLHGLRNGMDYETFTDENGRYVFAAVANGSYQMTHYVPEGYVFTVKANGDIEKRSRLTTEKESSDVEKIEVSKEGVKIADHNIGFISSIEITGVCFMDANYNGMYDEGEPTIPGVQIKLSRQSNNVALQELESGADGSYRIIKQRGSTFGLRVLLPEGYTFTKLGDGEMGNRFDENGGKRERKIGDIELADGESTNIMIGAIRYGSITGVIYYDNDFSGDWKSGEPVAQDMTISLYNAAGERVGQTKTNNRGVYAFRELAPGMYTLRCEPAKGYAFTVQGKGSIMKNLTDGAGESIVIDATHGDAVTGKNIGMIKPATVSGKLFADTNDNGRMDGGEKGLEGAVVKVMTEQGEAAAITIGKSAEFSFNALMPGTYYLRYELPEGGVFAKAVSGGNTFDTAESAAATDWFTLNVGGHYDAPLCGALDLGRIAGYAYNDVNGNGELDENENFASGMTITLTPGRSDLQQQTVTTGPDGSFGFFGLRPDTYTLTVDCPGGSVLSRVHGVSLPLKQGKNVQTVSLTVGMGSRWENQLLGCVMPSTWSGAAYYDENDNGVLDAGEAPAAGETIWLVDAQTGDQLIAATTRADGSFTMEGIAPGSYQLSFPMAEGLRVPRNAGTFTLAGDALVTAPINVTASSDFTGAQLLLVRETSLAGQVWMQQKEQVTPIAGAAIRLLNMAGDTLQETTSGQDGAYRFDGLMPGDYRIDVTVPDDHATVKDGDALLRENGRGSILSRTNGTWGKSGVITVKMAQHQLNLDIGAVLPGRLGDRVWLDENRNGLQDGDEGGIPGVLIELLVDGEVVASATSDQYGYWLFTNLYPTEYIIRATYPAEVVPTMLRTDIGLIVSVLQENGLSIPVMVPSDGRNYNADLGFQLVEEGKFPAGYGEGETQNWNYKK